MLCCVGLVGFYVVFVVSGLLCGNVLCRQALFSLLRLGLFGGVRCCLLFVFIVFRVCLFGLVCQFAVCCCRFVAVTVCLCVFVVVCIVHRGVVVVVRLVWVCWVCSVVSGLFRFVWR